MLNVAYSLAVGVVVFAALFFTKLLSAAESSVPAVIATIATLFVLGRKVFKQLEQLFTEAGKELQQQRFDAAINTLKSGYKFARQQFGVQSQLDSQIGMILFLRKDTNAAIPFLERSKRLDHWFGVGMLAVAYFKKKDYTRMKEAFELVVKRGKKQGLAWNLYAYCLTQIDENAAAQAVLVRGKTATNGDQRVSDNLLALQIGRAHV